MPTPRGLSSDGCRLLRRGLHADLSGHDLPRRGVSPLRRAPRLDARRVALPSGRVGGGAGPGRRAGRHLRPGDFLPVHRADHPRDGRRWPGGRAVRRRDLRGVGHQPPLRDVRRRARRAGGDCRPWHPHRADLQQPSVPRVVSGALRAGPVHQRRRVLIAARLPEAAPEHLPGGVAPAGSSCRRGRDGRRQRGPGHRRRAARGHARGARAARRRRRAVWPPGRRRGPRDSLAAAARCRCWTPSDRAVPYRGPHDLRPVPAGRATGGRRLGAHRPACRCRSWPSP